MKYLTLENITFSYEESGKILHDFSMNLPQGQCALIQGDCGSGKSTLLHILAGLNLPQHGVYTFEDKEISEASLKDTAIRKRLHKKIGYLFQNPDSMLFCASVYDEAAYGPRQMGLDDRTVDNRVMSTLQLLGIASLAAKSPDRLSYGEKKLTALAAVLTLNPEVLLLDEPLAGLNRKTQTMLRNLLADLKNAGKTLILVSEDEILQKELADQVIELTPEE